MTRTNGKRTFVKAETTVVAPEKSRAEVERLHSSRTRSWLTTADGLSAWSITSSARVARSAPGRHRRRNAPLDASA
jgi:hypothetical protein